LTCGERLPSLSAEEAWGGARSERQPTPRWGHRKPPHLVQMEPPKPGRVPGDFQALQHGSVGHASLRTGTLTFERRVHGLRGGAARVEACPGPAVPGARPAPGWVKEISVLGVHCSSSGEQGDRGGAGAGAGGLGRPERRKRGSSLAGSGDATDKAPQGTRCAVRVPDGGVKIPLDRKVSGQGECRPALSGRGRAFLRGI
jgi:hypothetical protein